MDPSLPLAPINLRDDLPRYPPLIQLLRVTGGTVPGPTGYASASVLAPLLYIASTQQSRTDTLLPRDREPCLVSDVSNLGLSPGYYLGRLCNSYAGLPVYEVLGALGGLFGLAQQVMLAMYATAPAGVSSTQVDEIILDLNLQQKAALANLTPCQLQVLLTTLNISQVGRLTISATPTQMQNLLVTTPTATGTQVTNTATQTLVNTLTIEQILNLTSSLTNEQVTVLTNTLSTAQILNLTNSLNRTQVTSLINGLTPGQVVNILNGTTSAQLTSIVPALTTAQLQTLGSLPPATVSSLVTGLTVPQLQTLLTSVTSVGQLVNLTTALTIGQISNVLNGLTPAQVTALAKYPPPTISALVGGLPLSSLAQTLGQLSVGGTPPPSPALGAQGTFPYIPYIVGRPSSTPATMQGYVPIVEDANTGTLYAFTGGTWQAVGGSGGGVTNTHSAFTGSTTDAYVTLFNQTAAQGWHGVVAAKNTDGANSLNFKVTATDFFGVTDSSTSFLPPSNNVVVPFDTATTIGNALPPFTTIKLEIQSFSPGNPATYEVHQSLVG